jgi:eukaryotic-like serine/threonine-protein kinase
MLDRPRLSAALAGRYVIEREIGAGGMATVYLARELKHDREVAVKVLRPEIAAQLGAERFLNEVKITARLDHPHILTLIDSGESDGFLWYIQPYVRGESLRGKLNREQQLSIDEALAITRQVASALDHAHHHGVIHRDIKPENILLHEGEAMVADFGIALALTEAAESRLTATGLSLGTPQYMSPEQATGERHLDARSDIYSLAAVLYEMLAGVAPHTGPSSQAVIAKLLTERPTRLRAVRGTVPLHVETAVARALEKTPADRFPSAAEFAASLHEPTAVVGKESSRRRAPIALLSAAGIVIVGLVTYLILRPAAPPLAIGRSTQVTADPGLEIQPALSPDGRLVAYAAGTANQMRIFIRPLGGGRTIALSDDSSAVETQPRWSPDGTMLLFLTHGGASVAPAFGGTSRAVASPSAASVVHSAVWSPDGREIAFVRSDSVFIVSTEGGVPRPIAGAPELHSCAWASHGRWIACVSQNGPSTTPAGNFGNLAPSAILLLPVGGGNPVQVAEARWFNQSPVFSPDGSQLLFVSNRDGPRDVYAVALSSSGNPRGQPIRLSTGLGALSISLSADGRRLAYAVYTARSNIWSLPIPTAGPVGTSGATPITRGSQVIEAMRVSRDHRWLLYDSDLHGNANIYRVPLGGGPVEQLTNDPVDEFAPDLSPDGSAIAYHSWRTGTRDIEVKPLNGGPLERVTNTPRQESYPVWSPDGHALLFCDQMWPEGLFIVRRGPDGRWSTPTPLVTPGCNGEWSPDGRWIAYVAFDRDVRMGALMVIPAAGGPARRVLTPQSDMPLAGGTRWAPDGRTLYFKGHDAGGRASFWSVPFSGGRPRLLVRFDDPAFSSSRNDFSTDGRNFYFAVEDRQSDVFVADLIKR